MRTSIWALVAILPLSFPLSGQHSSIPGGGGQVGVPAPLTVDRERQVDNHHLKLDVVVTNKAGKPVTGLQQQSFVITNNKQTQAIASFREITSANPDPVKIILLVDEVNANFTNVAYERSQIKTFLTRNGGKLPHPVSIIFFSDTGTEGLTGSSQDGNALAAAMEQHDTKLRTLRRSAGFYGAVDRFQLSIQNLQAITHQEEATPGRKLLLWISPGWPYLSGPQVNLSKREEQGIFDSIVSLSTALRRARITLYSVDPLGTTDSVTFRTTYWEEFTKGAASPKDVQAGSLALQVLASQSGGRVLNSNNDVASLIAKASSDADSYYELTVDTAPAEHPDEYHALQVKVEQPNQSGLIVRTRTGYYVQP